MKKHNIFILLSTVIYFGCASYNLSSNNLVVWKGVDQLKFDDFKANASKKESNHNLGLSWIEYYIEKDINKTTKLPNFRVKCYLNKKESFIKRKGDTITLLHEQIHFNIIELYCRKMRKEWKILNNKNVKKTKEYYKVSVKYEKKCDSIDEIYDAEVYNQKDLSMLYRWNERINNELRELEKYRSVE